MSIKKYAYRMLRPMMCASASLKPKKNKVVFISFNGASYNDNPRAISEKLHEVSPETEIVWAFNNPSEKKKEIPSYIRCVENRHKVLMKELSEAKVWVSNFLLSPLLYKAKSQIYIQTWHGDRAFKKILFDRVGKYSKYKTLLEQKSCDYILTGSEFGEKLVRSAFRYDGELLKCGCPRNDKLINHTPDDILNMKKHLGVAENKKIFMYAPTLREKTVLDNGLQEAQGINLKETLEALEAKYNCEWVCFVRAHQNGNGLCGIEYDDKIMDMSKYPDMADLLLATDVLITDYSSSHSDFAFMGKPAILFQDDRKIYLDGEREFYYDLDETPFMIAQSQAELMEIINKLDEEAVKKNCKDILDFYGTYENGQASEKVVDKICSILN